MNSGIRFSVALIVVIMVLLGFYYASLDDGSGEGDGEGTTAPEILVEAEPTPVEPAAPGRGDIRADAAESAGDGDRLLDDEPDTQPESQAEADEREFIEFPTIDETPADPMDETAVTGVREGDAGVTDVAGVAEIAEIAEVMEPESAPEDVTDDSLDDAIDEVELEIESEPESRSDSAGSDTESQSTPASSSTDGAAEPGREQAVRNPAAGGVGIHRLALTGVDSKAVNAAMSALARSSGRGIIAASSGAAWIPLPESIPSRDLDGVVVERAPDTGARYVLALAGEGDAVDLRGRVASTELVGSESAGGWTLRFRVTPEAMAGLAAGTRGFRDRPVAWMMNGRILTLDRPRIAITGRANVPMRFESEAAGAMVADALKLAAEEPAATAPSAASGPRNVVVGAGSLPPDAYTDYVIKPGDTFELIALAWFGDRNKHSLISEANPYRESTRLQPGEVLRLPPKDMALVVEAPKRDASGTVGRYRIRSGDNLGKIAQAVYGKASLWTKIYEANKAIIGPDPAKLEVGMELEIPE
jgi:nucleoid-associated protein YgaU